MDAEYVRRMSAVERRAERFTRPIGWVLTGAERDLAQEFKSIWAAYEAFCSSRLGITAVRMLDACQYPGREKFAQIMERYKEVKIDEATMAQNRDGLCGFWDRRFEEGSNR